jgi:hypothetical protein
MWRGLGRNGWRVAGRANWPGVGARDWSEYAVASGVDAAPTRASFRPCAVAVGIEVDDGVVVGVGVPVERYGRSKLAAVGVAAYESAGRGLVPAGESPWV